jgi:hypothetical protein
VSSFQPTSTQQCNGSNSPKAHSTTHASRPLLFIQLIIRTFQFIFLTRTVFFSHNKSVNSVFQPAYQHSWTEPMKAWSVKAARRRRQRPWWKDSGERANGSVVGPFAGATPSRVRFLAGTNSGVARGIFRQKGPSMYMRCVCLCMRWACVSYSVGAFETVRTTSSAFECTVSAVLIYKFLLNARTTIVLNARPPKWWSKESNPDS